MSASIDFNIRPYTAADLDGVIDVFVGAVRMTASRDYQPAQIDAWSQVDREEWASWRLTRPTFVADRDGMVIGFSDLEADGHLDMMFVHPLCQRAGVASSLLERIELEARTQALSKIYAEASITARPFFERRGFRVIAPLRIEENGQFFNLFQIEKRLDPRDARP